MSATDGGEPPAGSSPSVDWGVFHKDEPLPWLSSEPEMAAPEKRRHRGGRIAGGLIGLAALAGGALFAVKAFSADPPTNTPQQAVAAVLAAVENRDVIGLAESLAPGERDALLDGVLPALDQLKRLAILDPDLNLRSVPGLQASYKGVKYQTTELRSDLAAVSITGGHFSTSIDVSRLPLGKFVRDLAGDKLTKQQTQSSEEALVTNDPLVVIREHNTWFLSLNYTAAYASTHELPPAGSGVPAAGAATPETAVSDFLNAAAGLDIRRVVQLLAPDELPAVHDYAGRFVPQAEEQVRGTRGQYTVSFPGLQLTSEGSGATRTVKITKFGAKVSFATSDGQQVTAELAGRCITLNIGGDVKKRCGTEIAKLIGDLGGPAVDTASLDEANSVTAAARKGAKRPDIGFVVVERDGQWYISPTRTLFGAMTSAMKLISRDDLSKLEDAAKKAVEQARAIATGTTN